MCSSFAFSVVLDSASSLRQPRCDGVIRPGHHTCFRSDDLCIATSHGLVLNKCCNAMHFWRCSSHLPVVRLPASPTPERSYWTGFVRVVDSHPRVQDGRQIGTSRGRSYYITTGSWWCLPPGFALHPGSNVACINRIDAYRLTIHAAQRPSRESEQTGTHCSLRQSHAITIRVARISHNGRRSASLQTVATTIIV